jgi:hypothetical protein
MELAWYWYVVIPCVLFMVASAIMFVTASMLSSQHSRREEFDEPQAFEIWVTPEEIPEHIDYHDNE